MCKHRNISITEFGTAWTNHALQNGTWSHVSDIGAYIGQIDIHCYDCGIEKTYYYKNRPKWLIKLLEEMNT